MPSVSFMVSKTFVVTYQLADEAAVLAVYADSDYPPLAAALARTISVASSVLKF